MIETERIFIRPFLPEDAEAFYELSLDRGFTLFPINDYRQKDVNSAMEWIRQNNHKYGVLEKKSGKLIGMGGLTPWTWDGENLVDITYRLRESSWGQGLGTELARTLMDYALQRLKLKNLTATITPDNLASKKIAESLGLRLNKKIILLGVEADLYRI